MGGKYFLNLKTMSYFLGCSFRMDETCSFQDGLEVTSTPIILTEVRGGNLQREADTQED